MKTRLIFFAALPLLAAALAASAQDENLAAQMAARRAAEDGGAPAAPAVQAEAAATNDAAASPTNSPDTGATNAASTGATNSAAGDDEDNPGRKAALAAALKALQAANNNLSLRLASLQIITQRNIFDPNRVPYNPLATRAATQIETFSLRGVTTIDGKLVATFVGDGVKDYPAYRAVGETVGTAPGFGSCDFKIMDITKTNVTLLDTKFTPKAVAAATNSATNSLSASATNSAASDGGKVVLALGSSVAAAAATSPVASATAAGKIVLALDQGLTRSDAGPWRSATALLTYPTFVARVAPPTAPNMLGAQALFATMPQITFDQSGDLSISTDPNAGFGPGGGRQRGRGRGGAGGGGRGGRGGAGGGFGGAGGGGFGGGAGGGFGGGGFGGGGAVAAPAAAAPAAAPDPAVLARLQAQRAQEQ